MKTNFEDYCLEYIRLCAVWDYLIKYNGTSDELNVVLGELEVLKHKMREELI